jgi:hypothetical protein
MQKRRFLLCAWVPNRTFSATLAFPGRYLLATVAFFVVVCFPLWLLLSAANLFIKFMQSFNSKEYVKESFAWRHYYWSIFYFILYFYLSFVFPPLTP